MITSTGYLLDKLNFYLSRASIDFQLWLLNATNDLGGARLVYIIIKLKYFSILTGKLLYATANEPACHEALEIPLPKKTH